ncbi:conserved membrane protein of unknown function [Magnetospira sp. QH-2]|nr:conserved membrane protein of unknown function [Magnetospira sp. QH-2]
MHRLARFRLVVPLQRSPHPPEYTARAAAIGLAVAFTPTVGIQLVAIFAFWALLRWHPKTDFSLVVALAWVWVTNVFTMLPIYYGFYVTGQFMLGRWDDLSGYQGFVDVFNGAVKMDMDMLDMVWALITLAAKEQGLAMFVGSIPWAIGTAWLGYVWSIKYLRARQSARLRRFKETAPLETPPEASEETGKGA